jgi:SAM-dependent methyltransferase
VNGLKYALDVVLTTLRSRLHRLGLLYERRYDVPPKAGKPRGVYQPKFNYPSSHTYALEELRENARVLDIGGGEGHIAAEFARQKNIRATILDSVPADHAEPNLPESCRFEHADLDFDPLPDDLACYDQILMLDILEHLRRPEDFLQQLRRESGVRRPDVVISCPNIAFFITRFMLLLGQFNYGPRGILDRTHTRLFTFASLKSLLEESGFEIRKVRGVPAPYPLAIGDNSLSRFLLSLNNSLIRLLPGLFSYQIFIHARPLPTVPNLLRQTIEESDRARREFQQNQS